jgi:hypothetical protein
MRIELERAPTAEDMGVVPCGLCGRPFTVGVVRAELVTDDEHEAGLACPLCVVALSELPAVEDGRFPSPERVWELEALWWRTPEFGSTEEWERALAALG